jgi:hypothetical protein
LDELKENIIKVLEIQLDKRRDDLKYWLRQVDDFNFKAKEYRQLKRIDDAKSAKDASDRCMAVANELQDEINRWIAGIDKFR